MIGPSAKTDVRAAGRRGAGAPPAEARLSFDVGRARASRHGGGAGAAIRRNGRVRRVSRRPRVTTRRPPTGESSGTLARAGDAARGERRIVDGATRWDAGRPTARPRFA